MATTKTGTTITSIHPKCPNGRPWRSQCQRCTKEQQLSCSDRRHDSAPSIDWSDVDMPPV